MLEKHMGCFFEFMIRDMHVSYMFVYVSTVYVCRYMCI